MRSSHSSLSVVCQNMSTRLIYRLQTRNPSEFCVNKSDRHEKKVTLSSVQKGNSACLNCSQLPSPHFFSLEKSASVKTFGRWWRQEWIFVRVLLQQLGGANDPILADALADALLHWMCPLDALNARSVMHTTDAVLIPVLIGRHKLI